jgi:hypothetical protein
MQTGRFSSTIIRRVTTGHRQAGPGLRAQANGRRSAVEPTDWHELEEHRFLAWWPGIQLVRDAR